MKCLAVNAHKSDNDRNKRKRNADDQKKRKIKKLIKNKIQESRRQKYNKLPDRNRPDNFVLIGNKLRDDKLIHNLKT